MKEQNLAEIILDQIEDNNLSLEKMINILRQQRQFRKGVKQDINLFKYKDKLFKIINSDPLIYKFLNEKVPNTVLVNLMKTFKNRYLYLEQEDVIDNRYIFGYTGERATWTTLNDFGYILEFNHETEELTDPFNSKRFKNKNEAIAYLIDQSLI